MKLPIKNGFFWLISLVKHHVSLGQHLVSMILLPSFSICRRCHPAKIFPICQRPWWWEMLRSTFYKGLNCWLRNGGRNDFIVDMLQRQTVWWCWSSLGGVTLPRLLDRSSEGALSHGRRSLDVARLWRFWRIVSTVFSVNVELTTVSVPRYLQTDATALHRSTRPCKVKRRSDNWPMYVRETQIEGRWSFDAFGRSCSKDADWLFDTPPQLLTYIIMWAAYRMSVNESCLSIIFKLLIVSRFVVTS